jgi:hypothetical protein
MFPSETHRLQFLMDLDVNAVDDRIYLVCRGLFQDGFRTLQIFLLNVLARCRQRTGTDSRKKTEGPKCMELKLEVSLVSFPPFSLKRATIPIQGLTLFEVDELSWIET